MLYVFSTALVLAAGAAAASAAEIPLDKRAQWFRHDRFGLFIHFGLYSILGRGEWIRDTGRIPLEEYNKLPAQFNPTKFQAAQWVTAAKQAGQKYLCITTKHHDGFCLFDTRLTDFSVMHTPFGRDLVKELADECHRQGLRLGLYYSIMDWHHPDWLPRRPWETGRSTAGADPDRYIDYMRGQLRELLTHYGRVDVLWFDGGWETKKPEQLAKFQAVIAMVRQLQPQILVNDRANIGGDFQTPEQFIPATGFVDASGRPLIWEATITMSTGHGSFAPTAWWGYDQHETVFKPADELIQKLIDLASKGGNLILNVGPRPDGTLRPEEAQRLAAIGRWTSRYGEAIYGTGASPFRFLPFFGRVTQNGSRLYVHVFDWPADRRIVLPGLKTAIVRAYPLGEPAAALTVHAAESGADPAIDLPPRALDPCASVIVVDLAGPAQAEPIRIVPAADKIVRLPAHYAEIYARHGQRAKPMSQAGRVYIGNWSNPQDIAVWHFELPAGGEYRVRLDARPASAQALGQRVRITAGDEKLTGTMTDGGVETGGPSKRIEITGTITADGVQLPPLKLPAGKVTLFVQLPDAMRTGPDILDLFQVELAPVNSAAKRPAARVMRIHALAPDGKPAAGTKIEVLVWTVPMPTHMQGYVCDAAGQALVELPQTVKALQIWARHEGCVSLSAHWVPKLQADGHRIPDDFTFPFTAATTIGGFIKDEDGRPIGGASIEAILSREPTRGGYLPLYREEPENRPVVDVWRALGSRARKSDAQGRWTLDNVPPGLEERVLLKLSHPDYISDFNWGGMQRIEHISIESLKRRDATLVMAKGIRVTGTVTDPNGKPVAGATVVWDNGGGVGVYNAPSSPPGGYGPPRPQVRGEVYTDAKGVYRLPPLPPAPIGVTVMAEGWAPDLKKITISFENPPVDFQLKPGKTLRLRFVDDLGKAVPGVLVWVGSWRGGRSLFNNERLSKIPRNADKSGVYVWTWAPEDAVEYFYGREGSHYPFSQGSFVADGTEHVVKLSAPSPANGPAATVPAPVAVPIPAGPPYPPPLPIR
jgi:alpha-L-fucosidase